MAVNEMRRAYADSAVRELIESRRKAEHDEATWLAWALQQGELKGKLEIARRMQEAGMDRKTILQMTGLQDSDLPT